MSHRLSGMWLPPPGFLSSTTSYSHIPFDPRAGREATYSAHQLEDSFWRNLAELESLLLEPEQGQHPTIHPDVVRYSHFEWHEVFTRFVPPSGSTQSAALLAHAVKQASEYVAELLRGWVPYVSYLEEWKRERLVEAMRVLRVDAHGSAGFREQASALHGSGGTMDFGHSNAAVAYTEGLMLLNPAFEELQDSDHTGHFQTIQSSLTSAPDPPSHRSESPVAFDHGYAHIAAAPYGGQHPFYLPQDHYQSLGHRQHQAQDRENVYLRVSRASRSSAKATRAAGGDAQESQGA